VSADPQNALQLGMMARSTPPALDDRTPMPATPEPTVDSAPARAPGYARRAAAALARWFDTASARPVDGEADAVDWLRIVPFVGMHLACLAVIWVGWSPIAVGTAIALYLVRMFAITGFYHRYFSHRAFRTSRVAQFAFGLLGASAVQRGPIWWAAHHRHHHAHSDMPEDVHSPVQRGFLWSHMGWFLSRRHFAPPLSRVKDLQAFPELRWLDRFDILVPVALAVGLFFLGVALESAAPSLGTTGSQMLVWGFFVSTVVCYHATYTINSLSHVFGRRRYETHDDSRNNVWLALLTLGEGWHNNHHHYPLSARQGFYWWEVDVTYYVLRALAAVGIIWDLKPVPHAVRESSRRVADGNAPRRAVRARAAGAQQAAAASVHAAASTVQAAASSVQAAASTVQAAVANARDVVASTAREAAVAAVESARQTVGPAAAVATSSPSRPE
jgi:stearoyl-CoA desaturase (delta-9 desaturase)